MSLRRSLRKSLPSPCITVFLGIVLFPYQKKSSILGRFTHVSLFCISSYTMRFHHWCKRCQNETYTVKNYERDRNGNVVLVVTITCTVCPFSWKQTFYYKEENGGSGGSGSQHPGSSSRDRGSGSRDRGSSSKDRGSSSKDRGSSSKDRGSSSKHRRHSSRR